MSPYMAGAILWLEDVEPDPEDVEVFTTTATGGWWSAPSANDDE